MEKELIPVFELEVNEDKQMMAVALVDRPAIEVNWEAFSHTPDYTFKVVDEDRRIVTGAIMIPNMDIPRLTKDGRPYAVRFTESAIERAVMLFMREGRTRAVNTMHNSTDIPDGVWIFEMFIADTKRGIAPPERFKDLPNGTAFCSMLIDNDEVWADVKSGKFRGFSIEGNFVDVPVEPIPEEEVFKKFINEMLPILENGSLKGKQ
jgi:hypothetical protein